MKYLRFSVNAIFVAAFALLAVSPAGADESRVPATASLQTLAGARVWLNGSTSADALRGKVVLVDVFTVDCENCQNITPNLRKLSREKRSQDLAIVGIHTPETASEHGRSYVVAKLSSLGITWPVAVDNDYALWKAYRIDYWPSQLIFDRHGKLRKVVVGDGEDDVVDATIKALIKEPA